MATDYSTLSIEELIALRGKRQLRNRGIYKSPRWWRQFKDKQGICGEKAALKENIKLTLALIRKTGGELC